MPGKKFSIRLGAVVALAAGVTVAGIALPAPSGATTRANSSASGAAVGGAHRALPATPVTDHSFLAGWYSPTPDGLASASAKFTVPTATCPSTNLMDFGWGVYAVPTAGDLNDTSQADVQVVCEGGPPLYYLSAFTPGYNDIEVAYPGDVVVTTLVEDGTTTTSTVHDLTTDVTATSSAPTPFDTAELTGSYNYSYVGSIYGSTGEIPAFGRVNLNKDSVNGSPLGDTATQRLRMFDGTHVQATASNLNHAGDGFGVLFHRSI